METWHIVLGTVGVLVTAWLTYRGAKVTAEKSREGVIRAADVTEQQSALTAWKELLEPYRERIEELGGETVELRRDLKAERESRARKEQQVEKERLEEKRQVQEQMDALTERIDLQAEQIKHWKRLARAIARFAAAMRDEVLRLGGTVPATPEELLLIQSIDDDDL